MRISRRTAGLVVLRGAIWGVAGAFFGVLLLGVSVHLRELPLGPWRLALSAAIAGAVIGAFYSAKRVAISGAAAGSVAGLVYLMAIGTPAEPWPVGLLAAALGLVGGTLVSQLFGHKQDAILVAASGLLGGGAAGFGVVLLSLLTGMPSTAFGFALLLAPLTGAAFTYLMVRVAPRFAGHIPRSLSVGPVAAIVAAVVGIGLWNLSTNLGYSVNPSAQETTEMLFALLPQAFLGGLLGGTVAGAVLELMNVRWLYPLWQGAD